MLLVFAQFTLLMFHNTVVKISEQLISGELVETVPPSYLPCRFLHNLHSFLLWEKVKIFDCFDNQCLVLVLLFVALWFILRGHLF